MINYKNCGNCGNKLCMHMTPLYRKYCLETKSKKYWEKIPCPSCGGTLSEIRANGKRHCYSCHFEYEVKVNEDQA